MPVSPSQPARTGPGALDGVVVVDLSRMLPGGYASALLADLGARVVKVEQPGTGDQVRTMPPLTAGGRSGLHANLDRGKASIALDLRHPEGRAVLLDLLVRADVLVESFRPGVLDRLELGEDVLSTSFPRLVHVAISAYGPDGPYATRPGHDIDALAYAGVLAGTGARGGPPVLPGVQVADLAAGLQAVVGALAALTERARSGRGQRVDVAMSDAALSLQLLGAGAAAVGVEYGPGAGPLTGGMACYRVYRCADGRHVALGALEPKFFARTCELLGIAEVADWQLDPTRQEELAGRLAGVLATRTRDEWAALAAGEETCLAPVLDVAEALADPNAVARGSVRTVDLGDGTLGPLLMPVVRLARTPAGAGAIPQPLGRQTDQVLADLGYGPERVAALRAAGVL
ncbi:MAG: CaiB/BaiF CoA transferase family protein [Actinomycetes bacterium]